MDGQILRLRRRQQRRWELETHMTRVLTVGLLFARLDTRRARPVRYMRTRWSRSRHLPVPGLRIVWDAGTITAKDDSEAVHIAQETMINQAITGDVLEDADTPRWETKHLGPF